MAVVAVGRYHVEVRGEDDVLISVLGESAREADVRDYAERLVGALVRAGWRLDGAAGGAVPATMRRDWALERLNLAHMRQRMTVSVVAPGRAGAPGIVQTQEPEIRRASDGDARPVAYSHDAGQGD